MRGTEAPRDGRCTAATAEATAAITYSGQSAGCGCSALITSTPGGSPGRPRTSAASGCGPAGPPARRAVQAEHHQRQQLGRPEQPYLEDRAGELLGLHEQGHLGGQRAEQRDGAADVQQPEGPRGPQRCQIGLEQAHRGRPTGLTGPARGQAASGPAGPRNGVRRRWGYSRHWGRSQLINSHSTRTCPASTAAPARRGELTRDPQTHLYRITIVGPTLLRTMSSANPV